MKLYMYRCIINVKCVYNAGACEQCMKLDSSTPPCNYDPNGSIFNTYKMKTSEFIRCKA